MLYTDDLIHDHLQQVCHHHGGRLPEPRTQLENTFLNDLATGAFLLGMSDTATQGRWVWDSDGSEVNWQNWINWSYYGSEPNGGRSENCVVVAQQLWNNMAGHKTDGWVDVPCHSDLYTGSKPTSVICERNPGLFICYDLDLCLITVYLL